MLSHTAQSRILAYTAWRYGCSEAQLTQPGACVIPALPPPDVNLLTATATKDPDAISVTRLSAETLLVRAHPAPSASVQRLLQQIEGKQAVDDLAAHGLAAGVTLRVAEIEPYLYLEEDSFRAFQAGEVRQLLAADAPHMASLHASIPSGMRWFVELSHPIVFGCFVDGVLAAVASHFLFDEWQVAAGGVLTHPDYRRQGYGKTVVSVAMAWALDRGYVCEWSTWAENTASYRLARALGFEEFLTETDYRVEPGD